MTKTYIDSIPANIDDSPITREIKRLTRIDESNNPSFDDPLAQYYKYTAIFKTEVFMMSTGHMRDSDLVIAFDDFTEELKNEILKLAREIVRERKGMI